ncbi:hypothetical protein [Clostridioides difficile]|uniref:hypothetical protein n=1 Tax=Clostridioides difficile TaxID=1496 RepID=UPI002359E427|nr:hypothetical protein [Clostridioides difficile]MDC9367132.1 hypothetical protein [Clostridioides difficile]
MVKNYSAHMDEKTLQDLLDKTFKRLSADPEEPFADVIVELAAEIEYLHGEINSIFQQIAEKEAERKKKDKINEMIFNRMKRKIVEGMNTSDETTELTAELNVAAADPFIKSSVGELYVAGDLYINISKFEPEKGDPDD